MLKKFYLPRTLLLTAIAAAALAVSGLYPLICRAWVPQSPHESDASNVVVPAGTHLALPITFTALGPDIDQIQLRPGLHRFVLRSVTGRPDSELQFTITGLRSNETVATPRVRERFSQTFEVALGPGEYLLTEASHPTWQVELVVEAGSPH
jgi:hypothetical protein